MGQPAARMGDMVTPGSPPFVFVGGPIVSPGSPKVLIGGVPAATFGSMAPPAAVVKGSTKVLIGGKPAARMGDSMTGGGFIVTGFFKALIY